MRDTELQRPLPTVAGLSTGAVARRFGVAPTTLRSWGQRYGVGPAGHQSGRHRRWTREDIAVLEHMCRLTSAGVPPSEAARAALQTSVAPSSQPQPAAPDPSGRPSPLQLPAAPGQARQHLRGLSRAALRLDSPAIENLLSTAISQLGLIPAWDEVIMPALHAVGRKWETSGERYVEVEHLLSWHVSTALRRVTKPYGAMQREAGASLSPILLACVPGESHTLPLEALAAALSERGVPVSMFGSSVPAEALDQAVRRIGPAAVVLWAQSYGTASRPLAQHFSALQWGVPGARTQSAVMVAGPGWAGPHLAGTLRPHRLGDAVASLLALCDV
ncbi:MerR family transcriptional regulator [Streptomyces sp. NPDC050439]|uniref:MerR family transcriptional regulator n=1 Tax=unclassified Streptomyces TaxID=2593676 RepID=UPI00341279C1